MEFGGGGEYSLIILFTIIGASILMSSGDIVSIFLSIELQSFAVYVLATLYRESESATSAGLKYFLLGGLSSAIILMGTGLIYYTTGLTHFESIYILSSVNLSDINVAEVEITSSYITNIRNGLTLGILLIGIGLLFKVASAPFHNWAPDVYDGTPTVVTAWLSTMPKISIFVLLLQFTVLLFNEEIWRNLLLITSLLSLVIGTVLGLSQYRIKRLLTYSTISHVGFLLLALVINSQESVESFLFYLTQYSITNVNAFIILLAFGYLSVSSTKFYSGGSGVFSDIQLISQLKGQFNVNPLLSLGFAISLFSIAGIPPLIGFFAKQIVLYSAMHAGYYFISIVAIVVSVISASYYLKIIQVIYFESPNFQSPYFINMDGTKLNREYGTISNTHSIIISVLTIVITLFIMQPIILLNSCHLLALSIFYY